VLWLVLDRIGRRMLDRLVSKETERNSVQGDERAQRIKTLWAVGRIFLTLVLFGAFVLLTFAIWGIPTTPFLALGSVIGIAIGFGAQDLVKDVIAGLFIIAEDQYGIDDVVLISGVSGRVEQIRLRTTVLRDLDGNVHHVPNGQVIVATNYTQEYAQIVVDLGISYDADVDEVIDVVTDEAMRFYEDPEWEETFLAPPETLGVQDFADSAVLVRLTLRVRPSDRWIARREFLRRIKRRFDLEGISIPYPHMTMVTPESVRSQDSTPGGPQPPE
jgi:small conductance mechanosensitive channel